MFRDEQLQVESGIQTILKDHGIPLLEDFGWTAVPFEGEWGIATSFFKTAAQEAKSGKVKNVPQRAEEIAALVAEKLPPQMYFPHVEAVGGYLNLYFDSRLFSTRVINAVIQSDNFGQGDDKKGKRW